MSCPRTRLSAFYRFAAFVALIAMLVPVATGLVHYPTAQSLVRICGIGKPLTDTKDKVPASKIPFCPICLSLQMLGDGFVPPDAVLVVDGDIVVARAVTTVTALILITSIAPQARPRAPPVLG